MKNTGLLVGVTIVSVIATAISAYVARVTYKELTYPDRIEIRKRNKNWRVRQSLIS